MVEVNYYVLFLVLFFVVKSIFHKLLQCCIFVSLFLLFEQIYGLVLVHFGFLQTQKLHCSFETLLTTHIYSHPHSHLHSHIFTPTHKRQPARKTEKCISHTHTNTLAYTHTRPHSPSLPYIFIHTHTTTLIPYSHTHIHPRTRTTTLTQLTHTHTHTPYSHSHHTHNHTHLLTLTYSHTTTLTLTHITHSQHTHTHTHTHIHTHTHTTQHTLTSVDTLFSSHEIHSLQLVRLPKIIQVCNFVKQFQNRTYLMGYFIFRLVDFESYGTYSEFTCES